MDNDKFLSACTYDVHTEGGKEGVVFDSMILSKAEVIAHIKVKAAKVET